MSKTIPHNKHIGLSAAEIDTLLDARRVAFAREAARVYGETQSLRKAAKQLGVSHETVRALLVEAKREAA